jgi:hypothetical protein
MLRRYQSTAARPPGARGADRAAYATFQDGSYARVVRTIVTVTFASLVLSTVVVVGAVVVAAVAIL